jgi:L-lactate utilization protein LutC
MVKCQKIKYKKEVAEKLAKDLKKKAKKVFGNTSRQEKRAYLCPNCQSYHLTSISQNVWELVEKKKREEKRLSIIKRDNQIQSILKNKGLLNK